MQGWLKSRRPGPLGIDLGSRALKIVQLGGNAAHVVDMARWDLPVDALEESAPSRQQLVDALGQAREGRKFRGRDVVLSLGFRELFLQNIRLPKGGPADLEQLVRQEVEPKLPFPAAEAELRYWEAAEVRQGDAPRREMIVVACHRPVLEMLLEVVEQAGLRPAAVEIEPLVLLRAYQAQFRRDEDQQRRIVYVHIGHSNTAIIIAQGAHALFIKYLELGGRHFDAAVSKHLGLSLGEAWALRRHNGDRRSDQQDPEVARSVAESVRPVVEKLANEIALCLRYHSVAFRGQMLRQMVLGGGEASPALVEVLSARLDLKCELGDPWRAFDQAAVPGRRCQWDVALGLASRPIGSAGRRGLTAQRTGA